MQRVRNRAIRLLRIHPLGGADAVQLAAALIASREGPPTIDIVCSDIRRSQSGRASKCCDRLKCSADFSRRTDLPPPGDTELPQPCERNGERGAGLDFAASADTRRPRGNELPLAVFGARVLSSLRTAARSGSPRLGLRGFASACTPHRASRDGALSRPAPLGGRWRRGWRRPRTVIDGPRGWRGARSGRTGGFDTSRLLPGFS